MQEVVGEGNDVLQMSEGVFVEHLADYPDMELSWLQQLYESSTHGAEGTTLNSVHEQHAHPKPLRPDQEGSACPILSCRAWSFPYSPACKRFLLRMPCHPDVAHPLLALLLSSSGPQI